MEATEAAEEQIRSTAHSMSSTEIEEAPAGQGLLSFADIFVDDGVDPFSKTTDHVRAGAWFSV